jgi:hypothetical protein
MASLALRVKEIGGQRQVTSWQELQLLIQPGQAGVDQMCFMGSPWILTGCWPGHRTGVDVANFRPDFPTICYNAHELDADGRVVFLLDNKLWCLPMGRYHGVLRVWPHLPSRPWGLPYNVTHDLSREALPKHVVVPEEFRSGTVDCPFRFPEPEPCPPKPECCILAEFDIDLGPQCHDHVIDQVSVEYTKNFCGAENGEA